jgi:transaldolase
MAILVDSADTDEVRRALELGFVAGVTTNPTLIAKVKRPGLEVLDDLLRMTEGPVFYQVTAETLSGRETQAREAAAKAPGRVVIKIPATTENLALAARLGREGIRCAITAVSSAAQAYVAAMAGADYAIPYVNRLTRQLGDGIAVVRDCAAIVRNSQTKILAASLKTPEEVVAAILAGAEDVTLPLDVLLAMGEHELSHRAIADFAASLR